VFFLGEEQRMTLGIEMKKIYLAMEQICRDTASLIAVVNDQLLSKEFQAVGGSSVMWNTSTSFYFPTYWMPYFQQRVFTKKEGGTKRGVGINILFHWEEFHNKYPVISCGLLEIRNDRGVVKSDEFFKAGWFEKPDPNHSVLYVMEYPDQEEYFERITNYFLPLHLITDEDAVMNYIVKPLLLMYEGKLHEAEQMVLSVAVTSEQINK
jgi:hypothetical protein